jgi:hypothetical protein
MRCSARRRKDSLLRVPHRSNRAAYARGFITGRFSPRDRPEDSQPVDFFPVSVKQSAVGTRFVASISRFRAAWSAVCAGYDEEKGLVPDSRQAPAVWVLQLRGERQARS